MLFLRTILQEHKYSFSSYIYPDFYSVSLRTQSECRKIRIKITPHMDSFYAVESFTSWWAKTKIDFMKLLSKKFSWCPSVGIGEGQNRVLNIRRYWASNLKCNFLFFNFELVTQTWKNINVTTEFVIEVKLFIFQLRVSNSKIFFF